MSCNWQSPQFFSFWTPQGDLSKFYFDTKTLSYSGVSQGWCNEYKTQKLLSSSKFIIIYHQTLSLSVAITVHYIWNLFPFLLHNFVILIIVKTWTIFSNIFATIFALKCRDTQYTDILAPSTIIIASMLW